MSERTPNVNFMISYVPCLDGLGLNHPLVKKYYGERQFYACQDSSYNYIGYVNSGSEKKLDYVEYSGNKEKSTGVFDKNGICDEKRIKELKNGFKNTKSNVWHGLVTFEEVFGKTNCNSYAKAYELMKNEFPKFLRMAGLDPNNIEWFAGFHTNTDHRHIHFSFYEKEPTRYRKGHNELCFSHGQIPLNAIEKMKINTELHLTQTSSKIAGKRNELTKAFDKAIKSKRIRKNMWDLIKKIIILMPSNGRISYDSDNMMFMRNKIDYLTDLIIKQDNKTNAVFRSFITLLSEKDESIRRMCEAHKINPDKVVLMDKYRGDLYRRLGNQVIKNIMDIRLSLKQFDFETNNRLAKKRIQRRKNEYMFEQSLYLSEKVQREAMNYFEEHMRVLKEMEIKVLIEQGIIDLWK